MKDKKYCKVRDHCHYAGSMEVVCIAYVTENIVYLKKITYFHTGSNYDYCFILKKLPEQWKSSLFV